MANDDSDVRKLGILLSAVGSVLRGTGAIASIHTTESFHAWDKGSETTVEVAISVSRFGVVDIKEQLAIQAAIRNHASAQATVDRMQKEIDELRKGRATGREDHGGAMGTIRILVNGEPLRSSLDVRDFAVRRQVEPTPVRDGFSAGLDFSFETTCENSDVFDRILAWAKCMPPVVPILHYGGLDFELMPHDWYVDERGAVVIRRHVKRCIDRAFERPWRDLGGEGG